MARPFDFEAVYGARYDRFIRRVVPGYEQIFPAALALIAARVPSAARVLVVGAGSGSELATFATLRPAWRLTGLDPSSQMIDITRERLAALGATDRTTLHHGFIDSLSETGPFDAATLDLVLHFLPDDGTKLAMLREIARRLAPGAPLVLVDAHGRPGDPVFDAQLEGWMRYLALTGMTPEEVDDYREQLGASVHWVGESRLFELLAEAGFGEAVPFYRFFVFGGWVLRRR